MEEVGKLDDLNVKGRRVATILVLELEFAWGCPPRAYCLTSCVIFRDFCSVDLG